MSRGDVKNRGVKKPDLEDTKHGCHECLTHGTRKYASRWFYVYCENTTLHGFRYITMNGSTIIESVFWFMVCVASIVFCVILMLRLWENYWRNPIATSIDTSNLIWNLPFPAVTICNNNKIYRPHADRIAKQLHMNGISANDSEKFFSSLLRLIRPDKVSIDNVTARHALDTLDMTVETLMKRLMQPCSELLVRCAWIGKIYDCSKIFKTVKSKEGFCCAFNSHYGLDSDFEYDDNVPPRDNLTDFNATSDDLPGVDRILDAPGSGRDIGLTVVLNIDRHNYKGSMRPSVGASILVHDAIDFADIGVHSASVSPGHILTMSVSGTSIKSMDSLRDLPVKKRSCYFDDEVPDIEGHYSFQSCVSECIVEQLQHICGCLPFYYPDKHYGVQTCYLTDVDCILTHRLKNKTNLTKDQSFSKCLECLPQCSDTIYNVDVEDIEMTDVGYDSDVTRGLDLKNVSLVYVYFGDISYVEYRRENILHWDELLASFGGIFGLCLGGSVMSAIELIYFLARELFKLRKPARKCKGQSRNSLPAASKLFLSIPSEKAQLQKPPNYQEFIDKHARVAWYEPTLQRRKAANFGNIANASSFKAFHNTFY